MPYIKTTTSVTLDSAKKDSLRAKLGQAIALIPGKSEAWLMLSFEDGAYMSFKGDTSEDCAFAEVSLFGSASDAAYERLTQAICEILSEELGVKLSNIYVKYEETNHWGWNGSNF